MAPVRSRKRKSEQSTSSQEDPAVTTPRRSPIKKRRIGITLSQKQALIENLQLEITERARRLRAQYNVQAQQLQTRVEMRVNRIPTSLRRAKMGDLLSKSLEPQQTRSTKTATNSMRPPPVPAKDGTSPKPISRKPVPAANSGRGYKRMSDEMEGVADKENRDSSSSKENPRKKVRGGSPAKEPFQPGQVLSPTSSNTRIIPARERPPSPAKSMIARPASPLKSAAHSKSNSSSNLLSSMVEKAKGARGGTAASTRKAAASTASSASTSTATTAGTTRGRKAATASTASTRGRRKASEASESSEASNATVVRKTATGRAATSRPGTALGTTGTKKTVVSSIKTAATKKATTTKAAPATTGRTLRNRVK